MDHCYKSFSFNVTNNVNVTPTAANFWGVAPENYWNVQLGVSSISTYNIQGYQAINIYKIQAIGEVNSMIGANQGIIVDDWTFSLRINGINNLINNTIGSSNFFAITNQPSNPIFGLNKFYPKVEFDEPITGVSSIDVYSLKADGYGAQNPGILNLSWNVNFIFSYKYEGE